MLLVDADVQPSLSKYFPLSPPQPVAGLTDVIVRGEVAAASITPTVFPNLHLVASDGDACGRTPGTGSVVMSSSKSALDERSRRLPGAARRASAVAIGTCWGGHLMLPLLDTQVRLVLLNRVTVRLAGAGPKEISTAGLAGEMLESLRRLFAADLNRLASMRSVKIAVAVDGDALQAGLRIVSLVNEAHALQAHFTRHGASTTLMTKLFKVLHKLTLRLRRELCVRRPSGRVVLPDMPRASGSTSGDGQSVSLPGERGTTRCTRPSRTCSSPRWKW